MTHLCAVSADPAKILFLYTEAAPYVMACLEELAHRPGVEVYMVRWPVNDEAPFAFSRSSVKSSVRNEFTTEELLAYVSRIGPDLIVTSGWVDKGYLKVCRKQRRRGIPIAMINDTAWRGDVRQWLAIALSPFWLRPIFTHAWVTGTPQAEYARRLGFPVDRIHTGFYSADTASFESLGRRFLQQRQQQWPHRFICVARYIPSKGQQYLCHAFAQLCNEGDAGDWELWIAGTGELHEKVKNSPSGKHPRIKHLGFIQPHEMPDVLENCGVFVLPSLYEPWGVVVHEHACAGFPLLLSSAVGSAEKFLVEMENGNRFIAGDEHTLRTMMRMMVLSSDAELHAMGVRSAQLGGSLSPGKWADTAVSFLRK